MYPSLGSVVSDQLGSRKALPPEVCVPNQPNPDAGPGYLSSSYGPFRLGFDGDGLADLLVGELCEGQVRIYRNQGSVGEPRFEGYEYFKVGAELGRVPSG